MTEPSTVIDRTTIADMTTDELDAALAQRRERRLLAFQVYQAAVESKKRATDERLKEQITQQLAIAVKEFARLDATIDKVEARLRKIAGIRLELEDYI